MTAAASDLIPLDRYDPQPVQSGFVISSSGRQLAWGVDDFREVHVAPIDALDEVTTAASAEEPGRFVVPRWAGEQLLIRHGSKGDDGESLERVELATGHRQVLATGRVVEVYRSTPDRVGIGVYQVPERVPREAVVSASTDPDIAEEITVYDDLERRVLEVRTVRLDDGTSDTTWRGHPRGWIYLDEDLRPRAVARISHDTDGFDGGLRPVSTVARLFRLDPSGGYRRVYRTVEYDGSRFLPTRVLGVVDEGLALIERRDGVSALVSIDLASGRDRVILESQGPDLATAVLEPDGSVAAVALADERWRWWIARPELEEAVHTLSERSGGDVTTFQTRGERTFGWVMGPTEPGGLWMLDPEGSSRRLGPSYGPWDEVTWRPTEALRLRARDGLLLTGYLTRPDEVVAGPGPWPLVLVVHGGPWGTRDQFRWNPEHQRFADLGYAVLSVNFRGSDGFGQAFKEASDRQWGLAMQTDLLDGIGWAVDQGVADPDRLAIVGASYGGYAALQALTTTPETFTCGVAGATTAVLYGPDLPSVLDEGDDDPIRIGNRATRIAASPLTHVERLRAPLLVWHGERDLLVPTTAVDGFVDAARARGAPISLVVFPEGGHGFARREDRDALSVVTARFLAGCLGGRAEGWDALPDGAQLRVEAGAEQLAGLAETLAGRSGSGSPVR